jgi:hypothetical protein
MAYFLTDVHSLADMILNRTGFSCFDGFAVMMRQFPRHSSDAFSLNSRLHAISTMSIPQRTHEGRRVLGKAAEYETSTIRTYVHLENQTLPSH